MFAELPGSAKTFYNSIMVESLDALKLKPCSTTSTL